MILDKIFDDKTRVDLSFAKHLDDTYSFLDGSSRPEFALVRNMINEWFTSYPIHEKHELKSRFKTGFSSAFFELFIFELFTRIGFKLTIHPKLGHTKKTPDFLAEGFGVSFYIEAKEANDKSENEAAQEKQLNALYDEISKLRLPNFWLCIERLIIKTKQQPSGRKLKTAIKREIAKYSVEEIARRIDNEGWREESHIIVESDEVSFAGNLLPKSAELRDSEDSTTIGVYPSKSFWGGAEQSIRESIKKKASRYGILDKPYLICLNVFSDTGISDFGVKAAVLGSLIYTWSNNPDDRQERLERDKDGLFLSKAGPQITRVSGIFITNVFPSNALIANHWLFKHPFAKCPLDFSALKLESEQLVKNHWITTPGSKIGDILTQPTSSHAHRNPAVD